MHNTQCKFENLSTAMPTHTWKLLLICTFLPTPPDLILVSCAAMSAYCSSNPMHCNACHPIRRVAREMQPSEHSKPNCTPLGSSCSSGDTQSSTCPPSTQQLLTSKSMTAAAMMLMELHNPQCKQECGISCGLGWHGCVAWQGVPMWRMWC